MSNTRWTIVSLYCLSIFGVAFASQAKLNAQDSKSQVLLRYKLQPGEKLVSRVTHFAQTRTQMAGHNEDSNSRTTSVKVWEVKSVSPEGDMTFEYRIDSVNLAQSVGEGEEIHFDSEKDTEVPDIFRQVADTIAKPLATITINGQGQVIKRDNDLNAPKLGIGELTIPLPEEPVKVGGNWSVPRELRVKLDNGMYKKIKVRELYTLDKVSAGVATLRIETQPLTPVTDPAVEAQLIQQLSRGKIKFDLDNGRLMSKELNWSDEVVGFRGPETALQYDAEFTEELLPESIRTATTKTKATK